MSQDVFAAAVADRPKNRWRNLYERGATMVFAGKLDPRFSYCMYVPADFDLAPQTYTALVSVHGTFRDMAAYRNAFSQFSETNRCVVIAPLFPVGVRGDDNSSGYKMLLEGDIRYDEILLGMLDEAGARLGARFEKFLLFGFSGGGQFVQRFAYLHPDRLRAVSIGSPGSVTLLDDTRDWWAGIRNVKALFGKDVDLAALRRVAVQLTVGAADTETWEIQYAPGSAQYMEGINDTGRTRIERNTTLKKNLEAHGITVSQQIVPGVAHDVMKIVPYVQEFFREVLCTT